ncbi:MAG: hypothetical protein ABS79_01620 [Planctomycetes bacterium SCN 63-9]|nr:MAG: hypothetical protein ABS79_01620 [Planctomycetes bacterium SCN 63-9]
MIRQLKQVENYYQGGQPMRAATLHAKLVDEYGQNAELADLFPPANDPSATPEASSAPSNPNVPPPKPPSAEKAPAGTEQPKAQPSPIEASPKAEAVPKAN